MKFDDGYKKRAANLIKDAKKKAYSSKTSVAFKNYKADGPVGRILTVAGGSLMISVTAAVAGSVALAAGIAASAVTFGIAPAVSIVLTYALAKAGGEFWYQKKSKQLKKGISDDEPWALTINDPALLVPGISKVLKKWTRVHRRATQLQGGVRGTATGARHSLTSMRAAMKNTRLGRRIYKTEETMFSPFGKASTDHELSDRLYELRFYSQMLFNYVRTLIDDVAIKERDGVVDMCELAYIHVLRQVDFTGQHQHCKNCYGMSDKQVKSRLKEFERMAQTSSNGQKTQASFVVKGGPSNGLLQQMTNRSSHISNSNALLANLQMIQTNADDNNRKMEKTANDQMNTWGMRLAQGSPEATAAYQAVTKTAYMAEGAAQQTVGDAVSFVATKGGYGAASVVFTEFALTVKNRLTRHSVLKRTGQAFDLTQEGNGARNEATAEFEDLLKSTDITKRGYRVATKVASYITKLSEIKATLQPTFNKLAQQNNQAIFSSCDEAHEFVYGLNYYFRNCEKFIAFLVYLETILIDVDLKVATLNIGPSVGSIIDTSLHASIPPKPKTVK
ncbi:MAG: hypothetical protein HRT52_11500 [Colwellia sp.]|nr:hypothetical protein [Colwellia sp.]